MLLTLLVIVSSDVSRSSCTTSFTPCCLIFCHAHVFFQGCPCPILDVINVHPGVPLLLFPGIIPRMHVLTRLHRSISFVSACLTKESHFSFDNLGKEFASSLKFIQYALVCPFLHPTYPQHSSVAPHFCCLYNVDRTSLDISNDLRLHVSVSSLQLRL